MIKCIIKLLNSLRRKNMGRHKKIVTEVEMPKLEPEPVPFEPVEVEVNLKSLALGIAKDSDGKWYVTKVPFDLVSGKSGTPERTGQGDDRMVAVERFKIEAANSVLKND